MEKAGPQSGTIILDGEGGPGGEAFVFCGLCAQFPEQPQDASVPLAVEAETRQQPMGIWSPVTWANGKWGRVGQEGIWDENYRELSELELPWLAGGFSRSQTCSQPPHFPEGFKGPLWLPGLQKGVPPMGH